MARAPSCHPDRKHYGLGLCRQCWGKTPESKARRKEWDKKRNSNPERKRERNRWSQETADRRRRWMQAYKLSKGCADCGYNERYEALDFDHVRGEKSFAVSDVGARSMDVLMAEIEKCDVVCANCHRIRTADRPLGTLS